jgi:hypothetical protein
MKLRHLFLTAFAAVISLTSLAQGLSENQRLLGYIKTDSITVSGGAFGTAGIYPVGAVMTPQTLSSYAGCKIVGIRMAAAMDLGRTNAFVYQLTSNRLDTLCTQKQRVYTGWNNIFFNGDGYEIKGNETLFFGFDYNETAEMIAADQGGLCGYGDDMEGALYAYGNFGQGLNLYSLSGLGRLCVQLIVDVSTLPLYDLDITWFDTGFKYKEPGENIDAMINFSNVGRKAVGRYQLCYQLDDNAPVVSNLTDSLSTGVQTDWKFSLKLPNDIATGLHTLKVFVGQIEGEALSEKSKNDTMTATFAVYRNKLVREKAYLEIYTDQTSAITPYLNEMVKLVADNSEALVVANIHKPKTPLAVAEAAYLHDLYAYTHPAFSINRSFFPGEEHIAYDMNDYLPSVGPEFCAGILSDMLMQDFQTPAFASVDLKLTYDAATRKIGIKATGDMLPEAEVIYGDLALTLMITEDQVTSRQTVSNPITGRNTTNQNYQHNDVLRAYVTSPIGDAITSNDNKYEANYEFTLDEGWNPDNIKVVGLLSKKVDAVTSDNLLDLDIINANSAALGVITGIEIIQPTVTAKRTGCFTIDGRRVETKSLKPGLYIINGKKTAIK